MSFRFFSATQSFIFGKGKSEIHSPATHKGFPRALDYHGNFVTETESHHNNVNAYKPNQKAGRIFADMKIMINCSSMSLCDVLGWPNSFGMF